MPIAWVISCDAPPPSSSPTSLPKSPTAKVPLRVNEGSGFLKKIQEAIIALKAPSAAEMFVVTAMKAKLSPLTVVVLPGLNPNQPRPEDKNAHRG